MDREKEGNYEVTVQMSTPYNLFYFSVTVPKQLEPRATCVGGTAPQSSQADSYLLTPTLSIFCHFSM